MHPLRTLDRHAGWWWLVTVGGLIVAAAMFVQSDSYPVQPPPVCSQGGTANDLGVAGLVTLVVVGVSAAVGVWRATGWRSWFALVLLAIPVVFVFWLGAGLAITQPPSCLH